MLNCYKTTKIIVYTTERIFSENTFLKFILFSTNLEIEKKKKLPFSVSNENLILLCLVHGFPWCGFFFANMSLDKTIEIGVNELFKSSQTVSGPNKRHVLEMLSLTIKENVILFDQKYYSQIDGVGMDSPLGPT